MDHYFLLKTNNMFYQSYRLGFKKAVIKLVRRKGKWQINFFKVPNALIGNENALKLFAKVADFAVDVKYGENGYVIELPQEYLKLLSKCLKEKDECEAI